MMERWKPIDGYPNYEVSDLGRVRRSEPGPLTWVGRILHGSDQLGYRRVSLLRDGNVDRHTIHRLVLSAFGPPAPSEDHECNHIDGDRANNRVSNLEWVTSSENTRHAIDVGLQRIRYGEELPQSKLTASDVREIRRMSADGEKQRVIAKRFGIHRATVSQIVNHHRWAHV